LSANQATKALPTIVIGVEVGNPEPTLVRTLRTMNVQLFLRPGVFVDFEDPWWKDKFDMHAFQVEQGRLPTLGEIGCALAHREAYAFMVEMGIDWALILEDDAEIKSPDRIMDVYNFLRDEFGNAHPALVSLYGSGKPYSLGKGVPFNSGSFVPLDQLVPGAVGYLLNEGAARELLTAQPRLKSQADWPLSGNEGVEFGLWLPSLVSHSNCRPSRVDENGERTRRRLFALQVWTWIWYVRNFRDFRSPKDYYQRMLRTRIFYKMENLNFPFKPGFSRKRKLY
jgi:GR25 family glycosyltransferase involved in LPS biosynthesis